MVKMTGTQAGANHLDKLLKEEENLEKILQTLLECQTSASVVHRAHREYYSHAIIKLDQINKHKRSLQGELYSAIMSTDPKRLGRAEKRLRKATEEQHDVQLELPGRLKGYAVAIKREADVEEALRDVRAKLERKREEIHTLRPCEALRCGHCRPRGGDGPRPLGPLPGLLDRLAQCGEGLVRRVVGRLARPRS